MNLVVVKTIKGMGASVCSFIDKLNLTDLLGATYGDDSVMLAFESIEFAENAVLTLNELLG